MKTNDFALKENLERAKRIELSTSTLARWRSTAELRPLKHFKQQLSEPEARLIDASALALQEGFQKSCEKNQTQQTP